MPARRLRHPGAGRHAAADRNAGDTRRSTVDSAIPSPFASALLFGYVANYIYDGDAPLAERRAQALAIDQAQLRELLGEAELRELLDADALAEIERQLQHLDPDHHARSRRRRARSAAAARRSDRRGDRARASRIDAAAALGELRADARRAITVNIGGEPRVVAGRIRRPLSRRAGRAAAGRACPSRCCAVAERGAGSRAALRAHARSVHHRGVRRALRARPRARRKRS